jgi:deazaflavin-dependent oxidoreductase (nitroreductase family)
VELSFAGAKDLFSKVVFGLHRELYRRTGGRFIGKAFGMPVIILRTTGRKSGKVRETMLTSPIQEGDSVVVVASYGGDNRHPAWFLNLRDNPDVEITMGGRTRRMRARIASADEKARMWPQVTRSYLGYAAYQRFSDRDIPVVLLEPI